MNNIEIIGKIGKFFTAVSAVFAILLVIVTYLIIQLVSPTAPLDYQILYALQNIFPYLFIAALSVVVAVVCRGVTKEAEMPVAPEDTEVPPETAPTEETE
jgi:hypothetical protein